MARRWAVRAAVPASISSVVLLSALVAFFQPGEPHINHLPLMRQSTPYTCGVAVLQSVLGYYGQEFREDALARELKADPDQGTDYHEIIRFANASGITTEVREGMTVGDLRREIAAGNPVVVAFQAWGDRPESYAGGWDDGHYSIVVGINPYNVYLMDPSTLGNYAFIPIPEFESRWHDSYKDRAGRTVKLVHFGITFRSRTRPAYNPKSILPLK